MSGPGEPTAGRVAALLRKPMTWLALSALILIVAATAALAMELYASTSVPMKMNSR